MKGSLGFLLGTVVLAVSLGLAPAWGPAQPAAADLEGAWVEWKNGNIVQAEERARKRAATGEGRHLLFLCAFVRGAYEDALAQHAQLDPTYEKRKDLEELVVHAHLHLGRVAAARDFARERKLSPALQTTLELRTRHPLTTHRKGLSVIPFAPHPLTPYFPAFAAELEGKKVTAHVDTGATFLVMGPDRAKMLGIELQDAGTGFHATKQVPLQMGVAKKFVLGEVVLENVPVTVMPTLQGPQDFVIFGTNILDQFLATLDYPNQQLLLSPRKDGNLRQKHLAMLPARHTEVPFYLWGDHYMFARGSFDGHKGLNFFIDSGLVSLAQVKGKLRQACFTTTPKLYQEWGVDEATAVNRHFEHPAVIGLGPLEQKDQFYATVEKPSWSSFGGVRIDGLLSHAFLNKYAWTLDFEQRRYRFSQK